MNPWKRLVSIFKEISEEKPPTYLLELDRVCARFAFVLSMMSIVIWLRYIPIDKSIFPEIFWMPYVRYGLILIGLINVLLFLFVRFRYQGIVLMTILAFYYINGGAVLAGVTEGRSIYFAGYIVAILVVLFTPLPKSLNYFVTFSSLVSFGVFAYSKDFDMSDKEKAFMVSLLVNVVLLSSVFIYILDRSRKRSYLKSKEIENRIKEIEYQKKEIETLSEFSRTLNEEQDINRVLDQVFQYISHTYDIDYVWLKLISDDKKSIKNFKFVSSVQLPQESSQFMNSFEAPLNDKTGTFYLTYNRKKSFYMNRNIEEFLNSEVDKEISNALGLRGFLIVPLMIKNEVIALISFTNFNSEMNLNRDQRRELERFCEQVAGALNTSRILTELSRSIKELKESQAQLIQSEKMAGLGQIVANVAHEINTPLGAIKASAENLRISWKEFLSKINSQFIQSNSEDKNISNSLEYFLKNDSRVVLTTRDMRKAKKDMHLSLLEKGINEEQASEIVDTLSEVGVIEVTDELLALARHPHGKEFLNFISLSRGITYKHENILTAADRTAKIVSALKTFSHRDSENRKTFYDLQEGMSTVTTIYNSLLRQGVEVEEDLQNIPKFYAYADELNQVWTNLIHNSIQAMKNQGKIWISARVENEESEGVSKKLIIQFRDNGPGIPEEIQQKIFHPFFTTKGAGEGSGLGLHITRQIIEKHEGSIELDSKPGNTRFIISIPIST
ncbi:MAG: GAF domain-containing protein [Leptospira sp.]|nr:GAF domain-containing protein [Leptospira sp.]